MSKVLLIVALVLALVAMALGFGWVSTDGDPHFVGWLAAALAAYFGSLLVDR